MNSLHENGALKHSDARTWVVASVRMRRIVVVEVGGFIFFSLSTLEICSSVGVGW